MYEIKTKDVYQDFSSDKEMFHFINYSTNSKSYHDSNKLVIGRMKYCIEARNVFILSKQ